MLQVTQYNCGDTFGGPPQCLQYFSGTTGTISRSGPGQILTLLVFRKASIQDLFKKAETYKLLKTWKLTPKISYDNSKIAVQKKSQ